MCSVSSLMSSLSGCFFFFSSRRRHTRFKCDWSSDVCSSDLTAWVPAEGSVAGPLINWYELPAVSATDCTAEVVLYQPTKTTMVLPAVCAAPKVALTAACGVCGVADAL